MTGNVVDRLGTQAILSTTIPDILSNSTITVTSKNAVIDPSYAITIATTLSFTVGIIQVAFIGSVKWTIYSYEFFSISLVTLMHFSPGICYFISF